MNTFSLLSHTSPQPQISPSSPQMWRKLVYKAVDNSHLVVRFGVCVRLSPSVDHLWMKASQIPDSHGQGCAYSLGVCGRRTPPGALSPSPPQGSRVASTHHPQASGSHSRGRTTPSTLSPSPTTTTTRNHQGFFHHLHRVGGGQLPYPRDSRACASLTAYGHEGSATEGSATKEDTSEDQS